MPRGLTERLPFMAEVAPSFHWRRLLDLIFPPRCGGCDTPGSLWCDACRADVHPIASRTCARCGQPNVQADLCANCTASPLTIDSIRSFALFDGSLRHAIHAFKYRRIAALSEPLGDMLTRFWLQSPAPADAIVPVPLHPARQRERGYNQAELLARQVGRATRLPVHPNGLQRVRATAVQMTLNAAARRENVSHAFECDSTAVRSCNVLLVDDVCTTGATLDACAVALKAAGALQVTGLTLARTP